MWEKIASIVLILLEKWVEYVSRRKARKNVDKELAEGDAPTLSVKFWELLRKKKRSGDTKRNGDTQT
jgi:hypothetical protein